MTTPVILQARRFAAQAHGEQKRKYTGAPYTDHLEEVAGILFEYDEHPLTVAAGFLHDVLEDTDVTKKQLEEVFGPIIAQLVWEVTDQSKLSDGNRAARKTIDRDHLAKSSKEGAAIKLADLISNSRDIVDNDPNFAVIYLREKDELLKVLKHGPAGLYAKAKEQITAGRSTGRSSVS